MSAVAIPGKRAALLMGLNYEKCRADSKLTGSIKDVRDLAAAIVTAGRFKADQVTQLCDDTDAGRAALTLKGIKQALTVLARRTRAEKLELAYVHFSGHAVQVPDDNADEIDGFDECLVAEDFETGGLLRDDWLNAWLLTVNLATRLVITIDACHSGSALDALTMPDRKILFLSASMDAQTAAERQGSGALTSRVLAVLKDKPEAWDDANVLHTALAAKLQKDGFKQVPVMSASHDLTKDKVFMPRL